MLVWSPHNHFASFGEDSFSEERRLLKVTGGGAGGQGASDSASAIEQREGKAGVERDPVERRAASGVEAIASGVRTEALERVSTPEEKAEQTLAEAQKAILNDRDLLRTVADVDHSKKPDNLSNNEWDALLADPDRWDEFRRERDTKAAEARLRSDTARALLDAYMEAQRRKRSIEEAERHYRALRSDPMGKVFRAKATPQILLGITRDMARERNWPPTSVDNLLMKAQEVMREENWGKAEAERAIETYYANRPEIAPFTKEELREERSRAADDIRKARWKSRMGRTPRGTGGRKLNQTFVSLMRSLGLKKATAAYEAAVPEAEQSYEEELQQEEQVIFWALVAQLKVRVEALGTKVGAALGHYQEKYPTRDAEQQMSPAETEHIRQLVAAFEHLAEVRKSFQRPPTDISKRKDYLESYLEEIESVETESGGAIDVEQHSEPNVTEAQELERKRVWVMQQLPLPENRELLDFFESTYGKGNVELWTASLIALAYRLLHVPKEERTIVLRKAKEAPIPIEAGAKRFKVEADKMALHLERMSGEVRSTLNKYYGGGLVANGFEAFLRQCQTDLDWFRDPRKGRRDFSEETFIEMMTARLSVLEDALAILRICGQAPEEVATSEEYVRRTKRPPGEPGAYNRDERKILINREALNQKKGDHEVIVRSLVQHETFHIIHYAFEQISPNGISAIFTDAESDLGLYTNLTSFGALADYFRRIRSDYDDLTEDQRRDLLHEHLAQMFKIGRKDMNEEELSEEDWRALIADELLAQVKTQEWLKLHPNAGTWQFTPEANEFFKTLGRLNTQRDMSMGARRRGTRDAVALGASTMDDFGDGNMDDIGDGSGLVSPGAAKGKEQKTEPLKDLRQQLIDLQQDFLKLDEFFQTYPDQRSQPAEGGGTNWQVFQQMRAEERACADLFREKGAELEKDTEEGRKFKGRVGQLGKHVEDCLTAIGQFDLNRMDGVRKAPVIGREGIHGFLDRIGVSFLSIADMIKMGKDIWEDITRRYHTKQEERIGAFGHEALKWVPKGVPYIGQLSAEFKRREKAAEQEEVEKWKKNLEELDAPDLQEMTHRAANKYQLKALLFILSERGRLKWHDEGLWKGLNKYSRFKIPIEACRRDETLREDWLRKVITDIWEDKDLFRKWRGTNHGAIEDEKKKFEQENDRLSNIEALGSYLGIMLRQAEHEKRDHPDKPVTVNPHHYESIIEYGIVKGKMSMEQKFFYLVQGVRTGIIGADRIRRLAGEHLNIFPVIDYFYQKNNSYAEIFALAERFLESNDLDNPERYKPGLRTKMWLQLELGRETAFKERLSKGIDKAGERMDHDDMHVFFPRADIQTLKDAASPQGGARMKFSREAWGNGYTGFNTFFKSIAALAYLDEDPEISRKRKDAKFTSYDLQETCRAIATFVTMDGIMTNRYRDTIAARTRMSWEYMRSRGTVVQRNVPIIQQRRKVVAFIQEVLDTYGVNGANAIDVANLISPEGQTLTDSDEDKEKVAKFNRDSGILQETLTGIVRGDGGKELKKILQRHMDGFEDDRSGEITVDAVKRIYRETPEPFAELPKLAKVEY